MYSIITYSLLAYIGHYSSFALHVHHTLTLHVNMGVSMVNIKNTHHKIYRIFQSFNSFVANKYLNVWLLTYVHNSVQNTQ